MSRIWLRLALMSAAAALFTASAQAQGSPGWPDGYIPSAGEVDGAFKAKADLGALASKAAAASARSMDNVVVRGADPTGQVDATPILRASVATGNTVYLPPGNYKLRDTLTLANGQCLIGEDRTQSIIHVDASFNPSATAVVVPGSSEPGACLSNFGIVFDQPNDQGSRANFKTLAQGCTSNMGGSGCRYPPAILGASAARLLLHNVRVSGAWDGVILTGNSGGFSIDELEVGALNVGFSEDGALDFCRLVGYEAWPFGLSSGPLYTGVYSDGATVAANIGRCDDWDIRGLASFAGKVNLLADNTQGAISNLLMDGDGANLAILGGFWNIANLTSTKALDPMPMLNVSGGTTTISGLDFRGSGPVTQVIQTGGILRLSAGRFNQNDLNHSAVVQTGGRLLLDGINWSPGAGVRTQPYVLSNSTEFSMRNTTFDPIGSGSSGIGLLLGVDVPSIFVQGNDFGGWAYSPLAGSVLGTYGPNKSPAIVFAPTLLPAQVGTWAPTYATRNGRYWYTGNGIEFSINIVFSTNAYTGASGGMVLTGFPFATAPISQAALDGVTASVTSQARVLLDSGYTGLVAQILSPPSTIVLSEQGSGVPLTGVSVASFPPNTTTMQLGLHGVIPTQ